MAVIYKNPELSDYFAKLNVSADTPRAQIPSIVKAYEGGRVIEFPRLDLQIDHDFWAGLKTDDIARLKKLSSSPTPGDPGHDPVLDVRLAEAGVPWGLKRKLRREIGRLYERVLPVYEALFSGYRFTRRQVVWRLNTVRNENMHVDTYMTDYTDHFARLFINLDDQPRIWSTSWTLDELYARFGHQLPRDWVLKSEPGDVWAVDSRQVAHQIFYGRRAVSIDFFVDPETMVKPKRHYLFTAARFRSHLLKGLVHAPAG